jgi:ABC-2 type transport system permease protein
MRLYWEIAKRAFQRQLVYRTANLAGLATNVFFGYIRAAVLLAAFANRGVVAGYDVEQIVTFTWVTQATIMVVNLWGGSGVGETIATGAVISDLSKPFSFLGYYLAREFGKSGYFLLFRCIPILVVGQFAHGLRWPASPVTWLLVASSLCLAVSVSFAFTFMVELTGFWTIQTRGIRQLASGIVLFFSGFIIPVPLFPEWLQHLAAALPFTAITQVPCDLFLERLDPSQIAQALGNQALWATVMLALAQSVVTVATRRVVSQGG